VEYGGEFGAGAVEVALDGNATVDGFLSCARTGGRSYRAWTSPAVSSG
jgi:hypothetical protein